MKQGGTKLVKNHRQRQNYDIKPRGESKEFLFASLFNNTKNCLTFTPQNKPEKKKDNNYTNPFCIISNHL